ncbi:transporter substrate-binding domain-containing protein [Geomonas sp. RF6]|uniref:ATP-binding protein n=1 Tax=Geomonas sp. RF6 TaxID=2897342 RepID=UPI001E636AD0|nr:transporter substrate-binding domain-containing protein [Geomonas sp. RF6]UFS71694.1 transporter substrate-binding domain-containing protein [Geomonas sp. RF6]
MKCAKTALVAVIFLWILSPFAARAQGVLRVGLYDFKPLIFKDENGSPAGLYVDVINHVARKEGWQVRYQYGTWKETYQALLDGRLDLVPCVGVTEARKGEVDFGEQALFLDWGVIYTRPGSGIETIFDLRGKRISGLHGSVYTDGLKQTLRQFEITANFLEEGSYLQAFRDLEQQRCDAAVSTNLTGLQFEEKFHVRRTAILFTPVKLGFAVKKGANRELLASLDREIGALKADKGSLYYERYEYWVNNLEKDRFGAVVWLACAFLAVGLAVAGRIAWVSSREVRQKKELLELSELSFKNLIESMLQGVALHELICDETGKGVDYRFLMVNASFERLSGVTGEQVVGRTAREVFPDSEPQWLEIGEAVVRTGTPAHLERSGDGLDQHLDVVVYRPQPRQFALIVTDITDRKKAQEELSRRNAELERFTYTVSHDLKSPLITVKGFSDSLKQDLATGTYHRMERDLERIGAAADKMAGLLNDLLELSRIGRVISTPERVEMGTLVQEVIVQMAGPLQEKGVEITVQSGLPAVLCDRRRLHEVWQNLLENAIKYLGAQPHPVISLGTRRAGGREVFFVQDNGVGIDPKYHQNIFGLFNKLDARTEGSGIGLALVKRIVEAHGGEVWVESEGPGKGSVFCFHLGSSQGGK